MLILCTSAKTKCCNGLIYHNLPAPSTFSMLLTDDTVFKPSPVGKSCAAPGETKPVPGAVNSYLPIALAETSPFLFPTSVTQPQCGYICTGVHMHLDILVRTCRFNL